MSVADDTGRRLMRLDALPEGATARCVRAGRAMLLCRVGARVHAVADLCTHEAVSLSLGSLCGHRLRCPLHGAEFDVRDGRALCAPAEAPLDTWPLAIEDGWIVLDDGRPDSPSPLDGERGPLSGDR